MPPALSGAFFSSVPARFYGDRMRCTLAVLIVLFLAPPARGWDADGHRIITLLALDAAGDGLPGFLREPDIRERAAWQSGEPDRWRGTRSAWLTHLNNPDHYLDIEDLEPFGLTLESLPPLRYEYLRALAVGRHVHPENWDRPDIPPYDPRQDPAKVNEWPGFLAHAIAENADKLRSAFHTLRILESLADASTPRRQTQIRQARENAVYALGLLSHFVGDAAQPLHTTRHHHGWVGPNPRGYTTDRGIHAYIDGGVLRLHGLTYAALRDEPVSPSEIDADGRWEAILSHLRRAHDGVVPLYELHLSGDLDREPGRTFIAERLKDAASMLAGIVLLSWQASEPTTRDIEDYRRYEAREGQ